MASLHVVAAITTALVEMVMLRYRQTYGNYVANFSRLTMTKLDSL